MKNFSFLTFLFFICFFNGKAQTTPSGIYGSSCSLDYNFVNTTMQNIGDMHRSPNTAFGGYKVPKGTGLSSIYASGLWIGGYDPSGNLHLAAMTYRQEGVDYFHGPLDTISGQTDSVSASAYDHIWKIDKATINDFKTNFANGNVANGSYIIPSVIVNWPAHGNGNYSRKLAPFMDVDANGIYNPLNGDYPEITGDQMLWWIFNDSLKAHGSTGPAIGIEVHAKAYSYGCPSAGLTSEVINYTTLYQYKIINRSNTNYSNVRIGLWSDGDLGDASDDYIGSDSSINSYYYLNGKQNDAAYGISPPMQTITILRGPQADAGDGIDNNNNGIVDEPDEWIGLSNFIQYSNVYAGPNGNPTKYSMLYNLMTSISSHGRVHICPDTTSAPSNFMINMDPYDPSKCWYLFGTPRWLPPDDMRGVGSCGPFNFAAGEEKTINFAYIWTRDLSGPNGSTTSISKNKIDVRKVTQWFNNNSFPSCLTTSIDETNAIENTIQIYPNPVSDILHVSSNKGLQNTAYSIYDITGRIIQNSYCPSGIISVSGLLPQVYLLQLTDGNMITHIKFFRQ